MGVDEGREASSIEKEPVTFLSALPSHGPSLFRSRIKGFFSPIDRRSRDNERASWLFLQGPQRSLSWRFVFIRFTNELVGLTLKDFFRYSGNINIFFIFQQYIAYLPQLN